MGFILIVCGMIILLTYTQPMVEKSLEKIKRKFG